MKKRTGADKSREVLSIQMDIVEGMTRRKMYEKERTAYKNSFQGQFEQEVRDVTQSATKEEEEAFKLIFQAMEDHRNNTYALIEKYLKTFSDDVSELTLGTIQKSLEETHLAISKLKKMCNQPYYLERLNPLHPNEYEKLFSMLLEKLDIRFALYAPKRSLSKITIKFFKMPEELKDQMFDRLYEFGLFENERFLEVYEVDFKTQLENKGFNL